MCFQSLHTHTSPTLSYFYLNESQCFHTHKNQVEQIRQEKVVDIAADNLRSIVVEDTVQ